MDPWYGPSLLIPLPCSFYDCNNESIMIFHNESIMAFHNESIMAFHNESIMTFNNLFWKSELKKKIFFIWILFRFFSPHPSSLQILMTWEFLDFFIDVREFGAASSSSERFFALSRISFPSHSIEPGISSSNACLSILVKCVQIISPPFSFSPFFSIQNVIEKKFTNDKSLGNFGGLLSGFFWKFFFFWRKRWEKKISCFQFEESTLKKINDDLKWRRKKNTWVIVGGFHSFLPPSFLLSFSRCWGITLFFSVSAFFCFVFSNFRFEGNGGKKEEELRETGKEREWKQARIKSKWGNLSNSNQIFKGRI